MKWTIKFHEEFEPEFDQLDEAVKEELLARSILLEKFGPFLSRPYADTLKGSRFPNMKELRFRIYQDVWRVAFAFDPKREAILLVSGNKGGVNETRFYEELIRKADQRFSKYLNQTQEKEYGKNTEEYFKKISRRKTEKNL